MPRYEYHTKRRQLTAGEIVQAKDSVIGTLQQIQQLEVKKKEYDASIALQIKPLKKQYSSLMKAIETGVDEGEAYCRRVIDTQNRLVLWFVDEKKIDPDTNFSYTEETLFDSKSFDEIEGSQLTIWMSYEENGGDPHDELVDRFYRHCREADIHPPDPYADANEDVKQALEQAAEKFANRPEILEKIEEWQSDGSAMTNSMLEVLFAGISGEAATEFLTVTGKPVGAFSAAIGRGDVFLALEMVPATDEQSPGQFLASLINEEDFPLEASIMQVWIDQLLLNADEEDNSEDYNFHSDTNDDEAAPVNSDEDDTEDTNN